MNDQLPGRFESYMSNLPEEMTVKVKTQVF